MANDEAFMLYRGEGTTRICFPQPPEDPFLFMKGIDRFVYC
jgi:hypothetical protein